MEGWVKIPRGITDKSWYGTPNDVCLFLHLAMTANFTTGYFKGVEIRRGQLIRSLDNLAMETGLTKNQIRTSIKHLISTQTITQETTHAGSLITVENYEFMQCQEYTDHTDNHTEQPTRITHGSHTDHTDIKKEKKNKEEKRNIYGQYGHVRLSGKEIDGLTRQFGENKCNEWIRKVDEYCEQTGKRYKNYALTIQNWARKENDNKHTDTSKEEVSYDEWAQQFA